MGISGGSKTWTRDIKSIAAHKGERKKTYALQWSAEIKRKKKVAPWCDLWKTTNLPIKNDGKEAEQRVKLK